MSSDDENEEEDAGEAEEEAEQEEELEEEEEEEDDDDEVVDDDVLGAISTVLTQQNIARLRSILAADSDSEGEETGVGSALGSADNPIVL